MIRYLIMKRIERDVDFNEFLKVLLRRGKPKYLPFYEHLASPEFIEKRMNVRLAELKNNPEEYWRIYVDFWLGMGYDCVPMEIPPYFPVPDTLKDGAVSHGSDAQVVIRNEEDFKKYPWPSEENPIDFTPFEIVAGIIPKNVKIVGGVCAGPYEWVSTLLGVMGLSLLMFDNPELVEKVFRMVGRTHVSAVRRLAKIDAIGALRQGDDLGFKTATFLKPYDIRRLIFPIYKQLAEESHKQNKPFILHSCGNLDSIYDGLIDECKIDAKHSFEDVILPVQEFKKRYGKKVTALGGMDVDFLCRASPSEIRNYARSMAETCFADGYWALGTGNSLTGYLPVENYILALEEGMKVRG